MVQEHAKLQTTTKNANLELKTKNDSRAEDCAPQKDTFAKNIKPNGDHIAPGPQGAQHKPKGAAMPPGTSTERRALETAGEAKRTQGKPNADPNPRRRQRPPRRQRRPQGHRTS